MTTDHQKRIDDHMQQFAGKYLTFNLGTESYGLPVLRIREIIRQTQITSVPQMPRHIQGVINLRGKIIPVVDLRAKFGLGVSIATEHRCIVVVQAFGVTSAEIYLGLLVDDVQEVLQIAANEMEDAPDFGCKIDNVCILGLAKTKTKVVVLLDIDQALSMNSVQCPMAGEDAS